MITYKKFGKPGSGNLGNNLFELAALFALSKKYETDLKLPNWQPQIHFKNVSQFFDNGILNEPCVHFKEKNFNYDISEIEKHKNTIQKYVVDFIGWFQSEKYFIDYKEEVKNLLSFNKDLIGSVYDKMLIDISKETIAISIRRGDYVNNPCYELLPQSYYLQALFKYFPDYENYNIVIFSDDFEWCKIHFIGLPNIYFADNLNPIEQICFSVNYCNHYIIANSTFSWWMAWLGEKENTKVIRPAYLFKGEYAIKNDFKDFYPERWDVYNHKDINDDFLKYDLRDVTFTIPVACDSEDRRQNLLLNVCILQRAYNTNIIIGECLTNDFKYFEQWIKYIKFNYKDFHRTKMLNKMCDASETEIVVNWDADVFLSESQIMHAVNLIRKRQADIVYPYGGKMARVPRDYFPLLEANLDLGETFKAKKFKGALRNDADSVGGAVFYDKDSFIDAGMENEYMISYAPEDTERFFRYNLLELKVKRVAGQIFHIDHIQTYNSSTKHEFFKSNNEEFYSKIKLMNKEQLRDYVNSWPWLQDYNQSYYETITEGATKSRDELFNALRSSSQMMFPVDDDTSEEDQIKSILDVGCGIGEWGHKIKEEFGISNYKGLDFRVPIDRLMIPKEQFISYNLKYPFDLKEKFDLILCLEVAEHLKEKYADQLIESLTLHSDKILFSAAIPFQSGINHYNEQWQSYWIKKFSKLNFKAYLGIREKIMYNENIELWYRQNIILFEKSTEKVLTSNKYIYQADFVHPEMYIRIVNSLKNSS